MVDGGKLKVNTYRKRTVVSKSVINSGQFAIKEHINTVVFKCPIIINEIIIHSFKSLDFNRFVVVLTHILNLLDSS